jgi:hypothetical protein
VGLRVYSRTKEGEGVELQVVYGENEEAERREKKRRMKKKARKRGKKELVGGKSGRAGKGGAGKGGKAAETGKKVNEPVLVSPRMKLDPDDQGKGMVLEGGAGLEGTDGVADTVVGAGNGGQGKSEVDQRSQ